MATSFFSSVINGLAARPYLAFSALVSTGLYLLDDVYLHLRQHRCYNTKQIPPELEGMMTKDQFEHARQYGKDRSTFNFWYSMYKQVEGMTLLFSGFMPFMWGVAGSCLASLGYGTEHVILHSVMYLALSSVVETAIELPWAVYNTFVLEQRHGFNKQTVPFFIKDQLKKLVVQLGLISAIMAGLLKVVEWGGPRFYIHASAFTFTVSLIFFAVYHDFIAPLFDTYTELPKGDLRSAVEQLASQIGFPLKKLYVVKGSVRSSHSNAYFYGFGQNKRIVLFDTLLEKGLMPEDSDKTSSNEASHDQKDQQETTQEADKGENTNKGCSIPQIQAVLAHELGHWWHSHVLKMFFVQQAYTGLVFYLFAQFINKPEIYRDFGFPDSQPALIGLIIVTSHLMQPINTAVQILLTSYIRSNEFQADRFAKDNGYADHLIQALIKLHQDNKGFPIHDWLYSQIHHSHPTLLQRIRAIEDEDASKPKTE